MLLIAMQEKFGPSMERTVRSQTSGLSPMPVETKMVSFVTNLTLPSALERIREYEENFNKRFDKTVDLSFILMSVSEISELSDYHIRLSRASVVENLPRK